eukprot:CAMPEP_0118815638 /NCGR_PEP_ID=MMETSP1162-20130426/4318_1 /TAXON_ID=33656 /ORGANISM="Phaeocystis Sp, Strain CCMP2710" /LENGTH=346 /DNA_ID=CAMNT_0006745623 /DNA_START=116 /DNA_END=1155 /DNA_ORIENTATION=-
MGPREPGAASSRLQLSVEAPVEALGVLTLSPCCAHAERACRVVCTRVAHSRRSRGAHAALTRGAHLGPPASATATYGLALGAQAVEEDGDDDERGAAPEAVVRGEVEEGHGGEARQKDRERHGEVLEVVVGEADDDGDEKATEGEHAHHRPSGPAEAVQPPLGGDLVEVALVDGDDLQRDGEEAQLHVAHPDGGLVPLEDLLEVDGGEARADAHTEGGHHADGDAALGERAHLLVRVVAALRHDHADDEERERGPLVEPERLAKDDHAQHGRAQGLGLVQQLQQRRAQVRGGDELQVVLQREAEGGHRDLERVELPLPDVLSEGSEEADRPSLHDEQRQQAEGQLE